MFSDRIKKQEFITPQRARCVMVLGCTSGAGKSWLATALCRWYAQKGYKVAPFKAQNMSNNARVVGGGTQENRQGAEIGSAQYFQALAAGAEPDVRMNPLLLKPESDMRSQVVLLGQVNAQLTKLPWRQRHVQVWPAIAQALDSLRAENDVVVIEGAGSPAEINLIDSDVVNMRVARHCNAACLLVADIDRGGAFAHLYGTWALLSEADRMLLHGFVLNKFRGDAGLLPPAPQYLQDLTGVPTLAVLPMLPHHGLPEEDGVFDDGAKNNNVAGAVTVAVIAFPHISNVDEFQPLKDLDCVNVRWLRCTKQLQEAQRLKPVDWIILPGSKNTVGDLQWLRSQGLDEVVCQHVAAGGKVLGICGGMQMLGANIMGSDTVGVEKEPTKEQGLGLLPIVTTMYGRVPKTVQKTQARFTMFADDNQTNNSFAALAGLAVDGYEIHIGQTAVDQKAADPTALVSDGGNAIGWINGNVLGVYLHGLFENAAVLQALFGSSAGRLDTVFNRMAEVAEQHFGADVLHSLLQGRITE